MATASSTSKSKIANAVRSRGGRYAMRTLQVLAGVVVALGIAEFGFRLRDNGAFPHVNFYIADDELGVRLEPGATENLQFRDNPKTHIRINAAGYRGGDWAAATDSDILVVGDSQVFGLGVEEDETFSAQLASQTGRTVLNAGVPTYGPSEYAAVVKEILETRKPATVVYVVNFVNDLFENDRLNRDRHAVWDGWAVRKATAPSSTTSFPGRHWLYSQSHLFYAWRKWRYSQGLPIDDRGFQSEGTWTDLVGIGATTEKEHAARELESNTTNEAKKARLAEVRQEIGEADTQVENILEDYVDDSGRGYSDNSLSLRAARGKPGDIVAEQGVEEGRAIALTASVIRRGVLFRDRLAAKIEKKNANLKTVLEGREKLIEERGQLHARAIETARVPSVLEGRLREVKAICDTAGVELVVVALPIDVQVSASEWAKYGVVDPPDMAPSRVLLSDLVATAEGMGTRAVDVTSALESVSGPAFLDHDIHMTPAGHAAFATALAAKLAEPAPLPLPRPGLPAGRTRMPDPATWRTTPEATVHGSTKAICETTYIDEWFRATCLRSGRHIPTDIKITSGGHAEASVIHTKQSVTLVTPLFDGEEFTATFYWKDHAQDFVARWPAGRERPLMWFEASVPASTTVSISAEEDRLCQCHLEVEKEAACEVVQGWPTGDCDATCVNLYGDASAACMTTYNDDCRQLLACIRGEATALPACPAGEANAGAAGQCFALCSDERACADGLSCVPWQGTSICQ